MEDTELLALFEEKLSSSAYEMCFFGVIGSMPAFGLLFKNVQCVVASQYRAPLIFDQNRVGFRTFCRICTNLRWRTTFKKKTKTPRSLWLP